MARTLMLTTPHQRGKDVERLQRLLATNAFGNFHPGGHDGELGPLTATAIYRAKYWLGYRKPNRMAGAALLEMLAGTRALPAAYRLRRRLRIRRTHDRLTFGARAVKWARSQLGTNENPDGSNLQPYGKRWGENGVAWCGLFLCAAWSEAGGKVTRAEALRWDYVPQIHAEARQGTGRLYLVGRDNVTAGDAVCLYQDGHVELFDRWVSKAAGTFRTVGGNTTAVGSSGGNPADGGHVADPIRNIRDVSAFVRLKVAA